MAGVLLANGSMSSTQNGEDVIRRALIEGVDSAPGVVDCMIALPGQLFYSTQVSVCLWFLARDKSNGIARNAKLRDRRGEILFIDARKLGHMVDRTRRNFPTTISERSHAPITPGAVRAKPAPMRTCPGSARLRGWRRSRLTTMY